MRAEYNGIIYGRNYQHLCREIGWRLGGTDVVKVNWELDEVDCVRYPRENSEARPLEEFAD